MSSYLVGLPTDVALIVFCMLPDVDWKSLQETCRVLRRVPTDSNERRAESTVRGKFRALIKGDGSGEDYFVISGRGACLFESDLPEYA